MQAAANTIYRGIFGTDLLPGDSDIRCRRDDFAAGYDVQYGTDLFLNFRSGMQDTVQEKFLTTTFDTATVEYWQNPQTKEEGDWFKLRVDYYFVGYYRPGRSLFDCWVLLDWPAVKRATSKGIIPWQERCNQHDGARASFRYVPFTELPEVCIYAQQLRSTGRTIQTGRQSSRI